MYIHLLKNKRFKYASFIFFIIFSLSILGEFIANESPIFLYYNDKLYFGAFEDVNNAYINIDNKKIYYNDPNLESLINKNGFIVYAPIKYGPNTIDVDLNTSAPSKPCAKHILGTDDVGRDLFVRILYGYRTSICFGISITILTILFGVLVGAIQGYFGGYVDLIIQRFSEISYYIPYIFVLIILSNKFEINFFSLIMIMSLFSWHTISNIVRVQFFKIMSFDYINAAKVFKTPSIKIIINHILPNVMPQIIIYVPFVIINSIITLASIDFLGFGLPIGSASIGELILQGKNNLDSEWILISATLSIIIILSVLLIIGDSMRDVLYKSKHIYKIFF